jgi:hypothetical protein
VEHPWQGDVVDVAAGSGEQAGILDPVDARTNLAGANHAIWALPPPSSKPTPTPPLHRQYSCQYNGTKLGTPASG